jgi:hypothetical protein
MNRFFNLPKITLIAAILAIPSAHGAAYFLATDQTGAQTQIDEAHTSAWTFSPNILFDMGGGIFEMKAGNSAAADVTLRLYQGADASGTLLATTVLTNTTFCAQVSNCGQFNPHQFFFAAPIALQVGTTYALILTSPAIDTQSTAYFIKDNNRFISDINGTAITPSPVTFGGPSTTETTPEPSAWILMLSGLALCLAYGRTRRTES